MSVELFLAINLAADWLLLWAVARALGCCDRLRVWGASLLCAAYAAVAAARPALGVPGIQLLLLFAVASIIAGRPGIVACHAAMLLCGAALISGGLSMLLSRLPPGPANALPCAGGGAALVSLMLMARHPLRDGWRVSVSLRVGENTVRFPALIDTGNRLREPLSGLPVLIAEAELLRGALPDRGWRVLRFNAVGGGGQMACFRPGGVWIERGSRKQRAPDVWVAVAREPLPGAARALAPCEFAAYSK